MSAAHTPGPWHVEARGNTGAEVRSSTGTLLAAVRGIASIKYRNAYVMAAAPEMLDALTEAEAAVDNWITSDEPCCDDFDKLRSALRAAIAKARQ